MIRQRLLRMALGLMVVTTLVPIGANAQNDFSALYHRFKFYHLSQSPRSAAMGGAYSALQGGEDSLFGNPAALGFLERPFVTAGYDFEEVASNFSGAESEADIWNINVGGAYPFEWGAVGLLYSYSEDDLESDEFSRLGSFFEREGDLERQSISLSAGYRWLEELAVGYRYSYFDWDSDIDFNVTRPGPPSTFATVGEDLEGHRNQFGAQYLAYEDLVLGLDGYFGLGDRDSNDLEDSDADAWGIRGGAAWVPSEELPLLVALDLNFENRELDGGLDDSDEDLFGVHLGAEYEVYENLYLRAGYALENIEFDQNNASESFAISSYTAGIGYRYENFSINYGFMFLDTGSGDTAHFIGIGYEF